MVRVAPLLTSPSARGPTTTAVVAFTSPRLPSTTSTRVATTSATAVTFGPVGFALAYTGIYGLHAISAAYLIVAGLVYAGLPATHVSLMFQLYGLVLRPKWFPAIASVHYALASIHLYCLVQPLALRAVRAFSLAWSPLRTEWPWVQSLMRWLATLCGRLPGVCSLLFARDGLFGVHSTHFELYFLAREVIETVLQTYQASTMTRLLPREKLNGMYTLILVINCWMTPLVKRVCRDNEPLARLLAVLCDVVLDFVSGTAVPVAIAVGYLAQYDPVATDFDWTLYYDDVWLLNFLNETPIVFFGSWLDAASRLAFSLGLLVSLSDAKSLVTRRPSPSDPTPAKTQLARGGSTGKTPSRTLTGSVLVKLAAPVFQARVLRWVHVAMILWGVGIAVLHFEASVRARPSNCSLELRPWLVARPACAVVTIDCLKNPSFSGNASDFETVYSSLDVSSVEYVIFRHCHDVTFTPRFLTFRNLYGVKTYNSTLTTWPLDAAFTAPAHPRVLFASFVATRFANATLPEGLYHPQFPPTLKDVEISVSNLQTLPPTLPWPHFMTIYVELSQLSAFPQAFLDLYPYSLSLAYNQIDDLTVPLTDWPFVELFVMGNPIQRLPDAVPSNDAIRSHKRVLSLEYTNLSTLPAWATADVLDVVRIQAAQTPLCVDVLENTSSPERETLLKQRPWLVTIEARCGDDPGPYGLYPLDMDATN